MTLANKPESKLASFEWAMPEYNDVPVWFLDGHKTIVECADKRRCKRAMSFSNPGKANTSMDGDILMTQTSDATYSLDNVIPQTTRKDKTDFVLFGQPAGQPDENASFEDWGRFCLQYQGTFPGVKVDLHANSPPTINLRYVRRLKFIIQCLPNQPELVNGEIELFLCIIGYAIDPPSYTRALQEEGWTISPNRKLTLFPDASIHYTVHGVAQYLAQCGITTTEIGDVALFAIQWLKDFVLPLGAMNTEYVQSTLDQYRHKTVPELSVKGYPLGLPEDVLHVNGNVIKGQVESHNGHYYLMARDLKAMPYLGRSPETQESPQDQM